MGDGAGGDLICKVAVHNLYTTDILTQNYKFRPRNSKIGPL